MLMYFIKCNCILCFNYGTKHYNYNHIEKSGNWTQHAFGSFESQEKSQNYNMINL